MVRASLNLSARVDRSSIYFSERLDTLQKHFLMLINILGLLFPYSVDTKKGIEDAYFHQVNV